MSKSKNKAEVDQTLFNAFAIISFNQKHVNSHASAFAEKFGSQMGVGAVEN